MRDEDVRKVLLACDEALRDHWGYSSLTEDDIQHWMADPTFDPSLWKVAWAGDKAAGGVLNYVDQQENDQYARKRGYTETIWVRRPWRRRGLARSLLTQSIQMFVDMGMQETALGVDVREQTWVVSLARENPGGLRLLTPWIVLIAPITEEIFFRGYSFPFLFRRAGAVTGYLVSTVLFALMHLHPPMLPVYLFYGLLFAYLYSRTSRLLTPVVAHCTINLVAFLLLLLTGGNL